MNLHSKILTHIFHSLILLASLLLAACGGSSGSDDSETNVASDTQTMATIQGQVLADAESAGVSVQIGSKTDTTDADGFFLIDGVVVPEDGRVLLEASKDGLVTAFEVIETTDDQDEYALTITMIAPDMSTQLDLTVDQSVALNSDQLTVDFPANAIIGGDENSTVSLTYGDPSTEHGQNIFPGDYSATNSVDEEADITLESIGFIDISVTSESGTDLTQLSEPAEVTVRLPSIYQTGGEQAGRYTDGDSIPWWSYDEELGTWLREDADMSTPEIDDAVVFEEGGTLFARAQITHFSWWNLDEPISTHACVTVQVVDDAGNPRANQLVSAEGVSVNSNQSDLTDSNGFASVGVKRTEDPENPETFILYAQGMNLNFPYDVTSASEGDVDTNVLNSPTQQGSLKDNTGECVALENEIIMAFPGIITGTITNPNSEPQEGINIYSSIGINTTTNADGEFTIRVPHGQNVTIYVPGQHSQTVVTSVENPEVSLGIILGNALPTINSLTVNPAGFVEPGQTVTLIVSASDPEGETLTYRWSATNGTLNTDTGTEVEWIAPSGNGIAEITVVVSDGADEVEASRTIRWDDADDSEFTVTLISPSFLDSNIEGITVVLHGTDNRSVERVLQTDSNGIANFGVLNRSRVTYTVIDEFDSFGTTVRQANTFFDFPYGSAYGLASNGSFGDGLDSCLDEEKIGVEARVINVPDDIVFLIVPFSNLDGAVPAENETFLLELCPQILELDDFPFVAAGYNNVFDFNSRVLSQAVFISDLSETYVFDLSTPEVTVPIINNTGTDIDVGVMSDNLLFGGFSYTTFENDILSFVGMESDYYVFFADSDVSFDFADNYDSFEVNRVFDSVPNGVTFEAPTFSFSQTPNYNDATETITWGLQDADNVDSAFIFLNDSEFYTTWNLSFDPNLTSITLPDLPAQFASAFDLSNFSSRSFSVEDFDNIDGFDNLFREFVSLIEDGNFENDLLFSPAPLGDSISITNDQYLFLD